MKYAELTGASIAQACEELEIYLDSKEYPKKDAIRTIFTIEEALIRWQSHFGEEKSFQLQCGSRWGSEGFTLSMFGERFDPFANEEGSEELFIINKLLNDLALAPAWNYRNGQNTISFSLPKKKKNPLIDLGLAAAAACAMGVLGMFLPQSLTAEVMEYVTPFYNTFIGMLSAISGPLVFFSVTWSICSIGDTATLGKIGGVVAGRFVGMTYVLLALAVVITTPFFSLNFSDGADTGNGIIDLIQMFLDIIPSNLVTPFVNNDLLQIISMSVIFGVAILVMSKSLTVVSNIVSDFNVIVLRIMQCINIFLPVFVFLSLWRLFWTSESTNFVQYAKPLAIFVMGVAALVVYYVIHVCITCKLSIKAYINIVMPAFVIALSTASSAAAYNTISDISSEKLGIHSKIFGFGIPLGQVIYMPCAAVLYWVVSLFFASFYDISITWIWLVMCFFICGILSIATPPIQNPFVACFGILFIQMGIPEEAITMAIIFNALTPNICVACNLVCRQCELMLSAAKLDMLDYDVLHASCGKGAK